MLMDTVNVMARVMVSAGVMLRASQLLDSG